MLRRNISYLPTMGRVRDAVANLKSGDQVCMPCRPNEWQTVTRVIDLSMEDFVCFSISVEGGMGHGGEIPIGIRKARINP